MTDTTRALVLFSGGQDSTTCLAWALERFDLVETLGIDYGQRHSVELEARDRVRAAIDEQFPDWRARLGEDHIITMPSIAALGDTAMTTDIEIELKDNGLPNTFVPGRNLFFLTAAAALGYRRGIATIVGGMCETDYSGYPDCREATIDAQAKALALGLNRPIAIATPLMHLDKAATWALAEALGGDALIEILIEHSHTCYLGHREPLHEWGRGCGNCPACELRAAGFERWQAARAVA